ncbi:uncharacterized protein MYCFIDRAFT_178417 [Pseudocercospora fijiensis CIRAD86]|uniref:Uncharacterized protein n=1 Tax=Pseudocercospora fijiensis (strain CIRAD86) TaxID=383855 RepID=M3A1L3_PSEFD|nr:uncharacterized protein MYCFIDRAFT_178417 [Pseudocercospora fijiensis CIRAD86]EME78251.1 hypothetical protein MYCFIDRAFT_178417 [Pseudocercospora fijiensis CIRAD86]
MRNRDLPSLRDSELGTGRGMGHANMLKLHLDKIFLAFCRTRNIKDEFLMTYNASGIFEGPESLDKYGPRYG